MLTYTATGILDNYWINTSNNYLVKNAINNADELFFNKFNELISEGVVKISVDINSSFFELKSNNTLWGLLINAGYLTVVKRYGEYLIEARVPNNEVNSEFIEIVAERAKIHDADLYVMFQYLTEANIKGFFEIYKNIVISCTSYFDAREYAYHMLFLGMCVSLKNLYRVTSNIESGYGRCDIRMESLYPERPHIIIEFKQGKI